MPPQIVPALRGLGYDTCSTASNHSLDGGQAGVRRTLDAFDQAGLAHAGTARTPSEQGTPAGKEWLANLIDPGKILAEARKARAAGASIVVVSLH